MLPIRKRNIRQTIEQGHSVTEWCCVNCLQFVPESRTHFVKTYAPAKRSTPAKVLEAIPMEEVQAPYCTTCVEQ